MANTPSKQLAKNHLKFLKKMVRKEKNNMQYIFRARMQHRTISSLQRHTNIAVFAKNPMQAEKQIIDAVNNSQEWFFPDRVLNLNLMNEVPFVYETLEQALS